jgi:hypothetical protein
MEKATRARQEFRKRHALHGNAELRPSTPKTAAKSLSDRTSEKMPALSDMKKTSFSSNIAKVLLRKRPILG